MAKSLEKEYGGQRRRSAKTAKTASKTPQVKAQPTPASATVEYQPAEPTSAIGEIDTQTSTQVQAVATPVAVTTIERPRMTNNAKRKTSWTPMPSKPEWFKDDVPPHDAIEYYFKQHIEACGVIPAKDFQLEFNKIVRFEVVNGKHGNLDGAYKIYDDDSGPVTGWVQDWHEEGIKYNWTFPYAEYHRDYGITPPQYTPEQQRQISAYRKQTADTRAAQEEAERVQNSNDAILKAWEIYEALPNATDDNPYLKNKGVHAVPGLKAMDQGQPDEKLIAPFYDVEMRFQGYQWITPTEKRHCKGTSPKGCFFVIGGILPDGDLPGTVKICEGIATALSVFEATLGDGGITICAFGTTNLPDVAQEITQYYTGLEPQCYIMADDDFENTQKLDKNGKPGKNSGLVAAQNAAQKSRIPHCNICPPPFNHATDKGCTDWNDYHVKYGIAETTNAIRWVINNARTALVAQQSKLSHSPIVTVTFESLLDDPDIAGPLDTTIKVPDVEYIANLFPRGDLSIIAAAPGVGKTWLICRTAIDIARGGASLGGFGKEHAPLRTLIFAGETGKQELIRRCQTMGWQNTNRNIIVIDARAIAMKTRQRMLLDDEKGVELFRRAIEKFRPALAVADSLNYFMRGDMNKQVDVEPVMSSSHNLALEYYCAFAIVTHGRKRSVKERNARFELDDVVGSGAVVRDAAEVIGLTNYEIPSFYSNTTRQVKLVESLKSRSRQKFNPFTFEFWRGEMLFNLNPDLKDIGGERAQKDNEDMAHVYPDRENDILTISRFRDETGRNEKDVRALFKAKQESGEILKVGGLGGKNTAYVYKEYSGPQPTPEMVQAAKRGSTPGENLELWEQS